VRIPFLNIPSPMSDDKAKEGNKMERMVRERENKKEKRRKESRDRKGIER